MGLIQSAEDFKRKIVGFSKVRILPADCLWSQAATSILPWISSLLACPTDFRFTNSNCVSPLKKKQTLSLSLSLIYLYPYIYMSLYISYCFHLSGEALLIEHPINICCMNEDRDLRRKWLYCISETISQTLGLL